MPQLQLDSASDTPLYLQVEHALRDALNRGEWPPHQALPPERKLAQELGVSRLTVRKALDALVAAGAVVRRQGSGTYAAARFEQPLTALTSFSEDMRSRGLTPSSAWVERAVAPATPDEALALGLSPGTRVSRLLRVREANGEPVAVELAVVPTHHLPDPAGIGESLYAALEARGVRPVRALQRIRAVATPPAEAALLGVPPGSPALHTHRVTYLAGGAPVEFTVAHYRADRYDFIVEMLGRAP